MNNTIHTQLTHYFFIILLMLSLSGFAQSDMQVSLSNSPGEVAPGGHFTLFFDVKSSSSFQSVPADTMSLPAKWKVLSRRRPSLSPGQKTLRYFYVVGTPANNPAGPYPVTFTVQSGARQVMTSFTATIQEIRKVEIFVVSKPEFVKEGDTLRISYLIQNSGNKRERVALKTSHGIIEGIKDSLTLEPNTSMNVMVSQLIPVTDNNAWQSSSDLSVHGMEPAQPVYQAISTPVFSSKIKKIDRYFRFPVEIGGGYLSYRYGSQNMMAYQYSASGRGYLDQNEKHFVDFTVRGPNQFVFPAIGSYDQYSLDYQFRRKTFVSVGDYVLQLNNLMEFGRFGRGVRVEQQFSRLGFMVFAQKARFYLNQKESAGGKVVYRIGESSNIGLNYASKNVIFHNKQFWSNMAGISGALRTKEIQFEGEVAVGKAMGLTDYGAFGRLQIVRKWVNVTSNFIYAGKNFYGFYNNSLLINNNIGINITPKLTVGLSGNFSNVNPSLDATLYSVSPKDKSYMAFTSFQLNKKTRFFLFYSTQEREDRQRPAEFHYSENFSNFSYNYTSDRFSIFYQGRYGYSRNLLVADNTGKKESFSNMAQPTVRVLPWMWVGGYLEHQHTSKFSSSDVIQDLFFYGGNARISLKQNLTASFLYRNNYAPDELYVRRSYLDVSVLLDLKRHRLSLTGGRSYVPNIQNTNQNTLFLTLKYALKLNIPLSKKRNMGSVRGQLTGSGFSKQGNLIQLGSHKFLTDSTGRFSFDGVAPDRYYLSITQNDSRNEGVIPVVKMPLFVEVKRDSLKVIEIPFTRTGAVTGKVEFQKLIKNDLSSAINEKPSVLVKLSNETTSFLTELNDKGEFSFKEMKPGNWTISAFIPGNQDRFVIDESSRQVDIETDKIMQLVFKIRPNEKRIHFSEKRFEVSAKK